MFVTAIIPARGGSKRVPGKNLIHVGGKPLIAHTLRHALESDHVNSVYVSTDDSSIATFAESYGVEVVRRPAKLSDDTATSESALLHVLDHRKQCGLDDPDIVVFLQCTSPVRRADDINRAIEQFVREGADSMFSACRNTHCIWANRDGNLQSLTYDYTNRIRSQDFDVQYRENGSIFLTRPNVLRQHNNRLGGKISIYEMDFWSSFEIDSHADAELLDWILRRPEFCVARNLPEQISLVVFDFDGVMTDNAVWVSNAGDELVRCNRSDGLGIERIREAGVPMLVLSKEKNPVVAARCLKLGIEYYQGLDDKAACLMDYMRERAIAAENVVYLGNDINDAACFELVGFSIAVADAHPSILSAADLILSARGGHGAVRELCDRILARKKDKQDSVQCTSR
jgi:YrbI family 3-deoxy-D-manno-octulosonate 8-phosphate phosphatase